MLHYKPIKRQFFTNTLSDAAKGKSKRGNTCCQIFVSDKGFVVFYPMDSKSQFESALYQFCKDFDVPYTLVIKPSR